MVLRHFLFIYIYFFNFFLYSSNFLEHLSKDIIESMNKRNIHYLKIIDGIFSRCNLSLFDTRKNSMKKKNDIVFLKNLFFKKYNHHSFRIKAYWNKLLLKHGEYLTLYEYESEEYSPEVLPIDQISIEAFIKILNLIKSKRFKENDFFIWRECSEDYIKSIIIECLCCGMFEVAAPLLLLVDASGSFYFHYMCLLRALKGRFSLVSPNFLIAFLLILLGNDILDIKSKPREIKLNLNSHEEKACSELNYLMATGSEEFGWEFHNCLLKVNYHPYMYDLFYNFFNKLKTEIRASGENRFTVNFKNILERGMSVFLISQVLKNNYFGKNYVSDFYNFKQPIYYYKRNIRQTEALGLFLSLNKLPSRFFYYFINNFQKSKYSNYFAAHKELLKLELKNNNISRVNFL